MLDIRAAYAVSDKVDLRSFSELLGDDVIKTVTQKLDRSPCTEVGSAYSDNKQNIGIAFYLFRRLKNTVKLFLVVIHRKIDPSEKIVSRAALGYKNFLRILNDVTHGVYLLFTDKLHCFAVVISNF